MKVFIVDDERIIRVALADDFRDAGYSVFEFANAPVALSQMAQINPEVIITDMKMPEMTGLEFLKKIKEINKNVYVILMTGYSTVQNAVEAMKLGAYDYITKPFDNDKLLITVKNIEELIKVKDENTYLRKQVHKRFDFASYVGKSSKIAEVFELVKIVAEKNTSVLITGETGTGKELITKVIHFNSLRKNKPLIKVSCAILSREIFESELFGHEKGAFTGADDKKIGRFELADSGTIYLDDIDDVPIDLQVKLLRALEEREIERVGGKEPIKVDIRVIASTKKNLRDLVDQGKFREDLFYRLNVFPVNLPPLRDRGNDIIELTKHFVSEHSGKEVINIDQKVFDCMLKYSFPGNTRELKNLCERLVLLSKANTIDVSILPPEILYPEQSIMCTDFTNKTLTEILLEVEKDAINKALAKTLGNKAKAADLLGIPPSTLKSKLQKFSEE